MWGRGAIRLAKVAGRVFCLGVSGFHWVTKHSKSRADPAALPTPASQRLLQLQKELGTSLASKRRCFCFCVTSEAEDAARQTKVKDQMKAELLFCLYALI